MFSCFHFPAFSLNCLLARDDIAPEQAAVLLSRGEREKSSLLEVNEAARQHGLLPGLRTPGVGLEKKTKLLEVDTPKD